MKKIFLVLFGMIFFACVNSNKPKELLIMCGSANKPAMEEITKLYQKINGVNVNMIFGGSGTLLSQIKLSRKGDIYLPGSPDYIIKAKRQNVIFSDSIKKVAFLIPSIIVPYGNPKKINKLDDLKKEGIKIGIGNPETVCLGLYGIELLEKNHLLKSVMKNVVTYGGSCSKTANLAALNKVDAILGWRVFHFWNPKKMEYIPINKNKIPRISYIPISITKYTKNRKLAEDFIKFVLSPEGKKIYSKWGYISNKEKALTFTTTAKIGGEYKLPESYFKIIHNEK